MQGCGSPSNVWMVVTWEWDCLAPMRSISHTKLNQEWGMWVCDPTITLVWAQSTVHMHAHQIQGVVNPPHRAATIAIWQDAQLLILKHPLIVICLVTNIRLSSTQICIERFMDIIIVMKISQGFPWFVYATLFAQICHSSLCYYIAICL